jgi:hypothetical protein
MNTGAQALSTAGSAIHGQVQDARRTRAEQMRHLGVALTQANVGVDEQAARRARLIAFADANRMDVSELAQAAEAQQVTYSSFSGDSREDRNRRFERFLSTAVLARNTGNAVAETTQLQGMLGEAGFDTDMQDRLVRDTLGMGNRGAVATQAIVRQGSQALKARMSLALGRLGPGATHQDQVEAAAREYRQAVAEMQVEQTVGAGPLRSSRALAAANTELANPMTQRRMLTNIRNSETLTAEQRTRLENTLFERGPGGRSQLRGQYRDMLNFTAGFGGIVGNNGAAFRSTFRGGGHGNPLSLQTNWRDMGANLLAPNLETGRSGADAVRELQSATISQQQIDLGAEAIGNDELSQLIQEEGRRVTALTDNTSALNRVSNALASFSASNPMLSAALGAGASGFLPAAGGGIRAAAAGGTALSAVAGGGAAGIAATVLGGLAAFGGGLMIGDKISEAMQAGGYDYDGVRSTNGGSMEGVQVRRAGTEAPTESIFSGETWTELGRALGLGFNSTANSPQATVHARAVAATGANSVAPESRASR